VISSVESSYIKGIVLFDELFLIFGVLSFLFWQNAPKSTINQCTENYPVLRGIAEKRMSSLVSLLQNDDFKGHFELQVKQTSTLMSCLPFLTVFVANHTF
jgi:hypothetical protein